MHVHLVFGDWFPDAQDISLPLFVANGVTGVRDMGSELDIVQDWRNEIEAGRLIGPRIYTPGPMLDGPKPRFPSSVRLPRPKMLIAPSRISSTGARILSSCNR